ncbi:MAG: DUF4401 domain-containing protein [Gemmatimonadaceae bacterium]
MRPTLAAVFDRLVAEGLAPRESIDRARVGIEGIVDTTPPWYARVIAGFGAWVATGFLVGFLFLADIVDEETRAIIVGALLVIGAVLLRRLAAADDEFKRQLALAVSLAGQVLVIVGVMGETKSAATAGLVALAMSIVLVPLLHDQAHRFMSGLIGSIAAIAAMADLKLAWTVTSVATLGDVVVRGSELAALAVVAVTAYVWRADLRRRSGELAEMLEPVGYGTIVALFGVLLFSSLFAIADDLVRGSQSTRPNAWHLGPATTAGITAALVALELAIFKERRVKAPSEAFVVAVVASLLLGVLTLSTPGVIAAVTVLTLGFDRRNRILIGIAVAFLVKFSSAYYYSLRMTLLEKSIVLVASGLLLLAARAYVRLRFGVREAEA